MRGENYVGIVINMVFNDVHRFVDVTQPEGFLALSITTTIPRACLRLPTCLDTSDKAVCVALSTESM